MATVYSSWVKGSTGSNNWRVRLDYTVSYPSATTAEVELTAYIVSTYGWTSNLSTRVTLKCGSSSYSLTGPDFPSNATTKMGSHTFTVSRGSSSKSVAVSAKCSVPSGTTAAYRNGATASGSATVSKIDYSAPNAPTGCSASRASDSQAKVTWDNGSTSTTRPRSSTKVERQADSGSWSQVASVGSTAENWTDNSIQANRRYRYRVRAYGAGGYSSYATSDYIYTTPAAPSSVAASKSGEAAVTLSIEGAAPWATSYAVERSTDGGSQWEPCGTAESFPWVDSDAPAGTVRYRVAAVRGSLQSAWAESNPVTTITPPLAPSLSGLPGVAATGSTLTVSWVPNHPDGSAQTSAEVEVTVGSGEPQTYTVEGAATSYQLPAAATESAGTVKVRVRTHGLDPDWGAWSGYSTVAVAVPPSAHFTSPAEDGASIDALPLLAEWEASDATGIAAQTLQLLGGDGSVLLARQLDGAARSYQIDDSVYALDNLASYTLRLTVLGGSSLSATAERDFSTDWAEPAVPEAWVEVDPEDLSCVVTVFDGEGTGDEPDAVSFSVTRVLADGSRWLVADGLSSGEQCIDPLPPLNVGFTYRVTAYAETGVTSVLEVPAAVEAAKAAFNFGAAAGTCELARLEPSWSQSSSRAATLYHFADGGEAGGLPVAYDGADVDSTHSQKFTLESMEQLRRLQALAMEHAVIWFRDPYGGRYLCACSWSFDSGIPWRVATASCDMTDTVFEEAW